jgi:hypothetical protein
MRPRRPHILAAAAAALLLLAAAACGSYTPNPTASPSGPSATSSPPSGIAHDVCEGSPPLPHAPLAGVLRHARCDQDMYYSMSQVADMLGVDCTYCHAAKVDGKPERDFPAMTHKKEIADWMSAHLMQALKPADGSALHCKSCHTDEHGHPVAHILGSPRDKVKANEWMSLVVVKNFVAPDGSKLKCKSCHVGTPGTPEFRPAVILQTEQLPPHQAGGPGPGF